MKDSHTSKRIPKRSSQRRLLRFAVALLTGTCLVFWGAGIKDSPWLALKVQPASAQSMTPEDVARQVYQILPNFPKENQYVSKETGKQAVNNTLASRLIRYHLYVKSRTPNYRLDWKLTLGDYLGANEYLVETRYPGYDTLKQSPMESDRAAISRLNRVQREALIAALVNIFNPRYQQDTSTATPPAYRPSLQPSAKPAPPAVTTPSTTILPKPGAADLLKP